jgi:hypothetical protein
MLCVTKKGKNCSFFKQFIQIVVSYIHWYKEIRIKICLGSRSPLEYRESLGLAT